MALFPVKNGPQYRSENQYRAIYCHVCTPPRRLVLVLLWLYKPYRRRWMATKSRSKWFRKHLLRHNPIYYFQSATSLGQTTLQTLHSKATRSTETERQIGVANRSPVSSHCLSVLWDYPLQCDFLLTKWICSSQTKISKPFFKFAKNFKRRWLQSRWLKRNVNAWHVLNTVT